MAAAIPQLLQERVVCSIMAAVKYEVPVNIVLAIAEKEGGKPHQWVKNSNGTFDVGSMQFNTTYLKDLKKYGITAEDVAQSGCYAFDLAAWRLRGHLRHDTKDLWTRAANYHSRTPRYNRVYRTDLIKKAKIWEHWLRARFPTYEMSKPTFASAHVIQTRELTQQFETNIIKKEPTHNNQEALLALDTFFVPTSLRGLT